MRLFEVDLGSARDVLAVLQGQANNSKMHSSLPFPVVMNMIKPYGLGISTPDGLIALKNAVDPRGDVIKDIKDDGTIILNTEIQSSNDATQPKKTGSNPSVDQMAKRNAKTVYK